MTGQPNFSCHNMWKLYGQSTESFLEKKPPPTLNVTMTVGVIPSGRLADCVEEFIRHIPRGEVMSVNRIVTKGESVFGEGILKSAKNTVVKSELPLSVVNEDGRITGTISKNKLISVLFGLED